MHEIDAEQPIGQGLAKMAKDHPQPRETIENAADDDAQHVQPSLHGEAVNRSIETAFHKRADHSGRRRVGMQVDGNVESCGGFEDRPELWIVEILSTCM